jgi:hypothetical protein
MEGAKTWLSSQAYEILFPDTIASIAAVTTLSNSLCMYVFFVYSKFFSSLLVLLTAHRILFSEKNMYIYIYI